MGIVNDGYGCILQTASPRTGRAVLSWCPVSPRHDRAGVPGALSPDWNAGSRDWAYRDWVKIEAMPWDRAEKPPFSWIVTCRPYDGWFGTYQNAETVLHLFVAPHVACEDLGITVAAGFLAPRLEIVRLDATAEVPLPGASATPGGHTGNRPLLEYFHGVLPPRFLPEGEPRPPVNRSPEAADADTLPSLHIERRARSIVVERRTQYRITVTLPAEEPAFFRLAISRPRLFAHRSPVPFTEPVTAAAHDFTLICSPNARADFEMEYARARLGHLPMTATLRVFTVPRVVQTEIREVCFVPGGAGGAVAIVTGSDNYADPDALRPGGDGWEVHPVTDPLDPMGLLEGLVVGFIPVLSQLYDVGDVMSIVVSGRDLAGREGGWSDVGLIAGFGLLGVVGTAADTARQMDPALMMRLADALLPGRWLAVDRSGFSRALLRGAFAGSPAMLEAGRILHRLDAGDAALRARFPELPLSGGIDPLARLRRLEALRNAGDEAGVKAELKALQDALEVILKDQAERVPFDAQPATLDLMRRHEKDLRELVGWAAVTSAAREEARRAFDDAFAGDALDGLVAALGEIEVAGEADGHLAAAMREGLAELVRREVVSNPSVVRRTSAYNALERVRRPISPLEYVVHVAGRGTEADLAVEYAYGREALALIRGRPRRPDGGEILDRVARIRQPDGSYRRVAYIDQVARWMNDIGYYDLQRAEIAENFPGLGLILNSDHLIEQRFRRLVPDDGVDTSTFRALLVPANQEVAEALAARGIDIGWYVHTYKTEALRRLIPHGTEAAYTTREVADAYQYFWVHELGMDFTDFERLYADEFAFLEQGRRGTDDTVAAPIVRQTREELMEALRMTRRRLGLDERIERLFEGIESGTQGFF